MKNKSVNLIKNEIMRRKARKYFAEHKKANSVVVNGKFGNTNVYWGIRKNGKALSITEVNTSKNNFVIKEADTAISGKGKKGFEYDPNQMSGPKGTMPAYKAAQGATIPKPPHPPKYAGQFGPKTPPAMPGMQQNTKRKLDNIAQGKSHYDPNVLRLAAQKLSDKEFGSYYGIPKKNLVKPPPLPGKLPKKENKNLKEASPAFARASTDFMDGMSNFDHTKLDKARKSLQAALPQLRDPKELEQAGKMMGVLTNLVDQTTGQSALTRTAKQPLARITPAKKMVSAGKKYNYKFVLKS